MRFFLTFLFLLSSILFQPGEIRAQTRFGAGLQAYPAGVIGVGQVVFPMSDLFSIHITAGYNATDRRDFGEHDDETGGGPGFGVSMDRTFSRDRRGLFAGVRADVWFLEIDWRDDRAGGEKSGTTSVTVFQPAGLLGYRTGSSNSRVSFDFTLSLGAEINVDTSGEPVGEGAIFLAGIAVVFQ